MTIKECNAKTKTPIAGIMPCWLFQVSGSELSLGAKILYIRLCHWRNPKGVVYRSAKQLAKEMNTSNKSIERYLKELRKVKLIGTYHPQAGGVNYFKFYDHPWMYKSLNDGLKYKEDHTSNLIDGSLGCEVTLPSDVRDINIKEIKEKEIKDISTSGEVQNINYTLDRLEVSKDNSDSINNQTKLEINDSHVIDTEVNSVKSDLSDTQTNKKTNSKSSIQFGLQDMLKDNIFGIKEQSIKDFIKNRRYNRALVTKTSWEVITGDLTECQAHGINPNLAFNEMVTRNWSSPRVEWVENILHSQNNKSWLAHQNEKSLNEQNIRARELKNAEEKRREIEASKNFESIVVQARTRTGFAEAQKKADYEIKRLGISANQYYANILKQAAP